MEVRRRTTEGKPIKIEAVLEETMQQEPWQIFLFGGLRAERSGIVLTDFGTRKDAELLTFLACYPDQQHLRRDLVEVLWPIEETEHLSLTHFKEAEKRASNSLSRSLSNLRKMMETNVGLSKGTVFASKDEHIQLKSSSVSVDVLTFEWAKREAHKADDPNVKAAFFCQAADLYKGKLNSGFAFEELASMSNFLEMDYDLLLEQTVVALARISEIETALQYAECMQQGIHLHRKCINF